MTAPTEAQKDKAHGLVMAIMCAEAGSADIAQALADERTAALEEVNNWCDEERSKLDAVDGYDYKSGEEHGLRRAQIFVSVRLGVGALQKAVVTTNTPHDPRGEAGAMQSRFDALLTRLAQMKLEHKGVSYDCGVDIVSFLQDNAEEILAIIRRHAPAAKP